MANQVGLNVFYQPTANEWLTGYKQHAAVITGWDEDSEKANLLVFPDGATYTMAKTKWSRAPWMAAFSSWARCHEL